MEPRKQVLQISENDFSLGRELGSGSFGKVYQGEWNGTTVAIKAIDNTNDAENGISIMTELSADPMLIHANIVKLHAFAQTSSVSYLVMDYVSKGSLGYFIKNQLQPFSNEALYTIMYDISIALDYLHNKKGILHRDIKGDNILLEENGPFLKAQLCDFDCAIHIKNPDNAIVGSARWIPPELALYAKATPASDVYSFGMTIYESFAWQLPFDTFPNHQAMFLAIQGKRPSIPVNCPVKIRDIIEKCWAQNPNERLTAKEIVTAFSTDITDNSVCEQKNLLGEKILKSMPSGLEEKNNCTNDLYLQQKEEDELKGDIIQQITIQFMSIKTKNKDNYHTLENILYKINDYDEKIPNIINKMIELFCKKCDKYDNKITLFGSKPDPITRLNRETSKHNFTRGVGTILMNLLDNQKMNDFLKEKYQIDIEKQLDLSFAALKKQKHNNSKIEIRRFVCANLKS